MTATATAPKGRITTEQRERESRLLRRFAQTQDPRDREELVKSFMPLARSLANRYSGSREPLEDLVQVANLALVKAIDGFDPQNGASFTSYAVPTILGELKRHFRDRVSSIHVTRGLQELSLDVQRGEERLRDELGRAPTVREVGALINRSEEAVLEGLEVLSSRHVSSLDAPAPGREQESDGTLGDTVSSIELGYDQVEANASVDLSSLDEREQTVLRMRFGQHLTQREIGDKLGVSQMQISRISRCALAKLLDSVQDGNPAIAELTKES